MKLEVGKKIKFVEERQRYTIISCNDRYAICTKPFNPQHTVLYTIIDLKEQIRGPEGVVFGFGTETKEDCEEMLERIMTGETEISFRKRIKLNIEREN